MRIAILTFHRSYNCGAMLQAWALQTVLERMGHEVEFPNCGYPYGIPRWKTSAVRFSFSLQCVKQALVALISDLLSIGIEDRSRRRYRMFISRFLSERKCREGEFGKYYDLAISGSDQVWNVRLAKQRAALFLGEAVPSKVRMISYAASCGDLGLRAEDEQRVVAALKRFEYISVRERVLKTQLATLVSRKVFNDVDPTLLLDAADYGVLAVSPGRRTRPYVYVYTLHAKEFILHAARAIAKKVGADLIVTPVYQSSLYRAPRGMTYGVSPERMIGYVQNASYVLASSFHGTAIALLHRKKFLSFRDKKDSVESRPASLLNQLGIGDRLVDPSVDVDEMVRRLSCSIPDSAYVKLASLRETSLANLRNAVCDCAGKRENVHGAGV